MEPPLIVVISGPNGAGKSTAAASLIPARMPFLNADEIAKGLETYPSQAADIEAGRILLTEMANLESRRLGFAVETTPPAGHWHLRIARLRGLGYRFRLAFAFLPDPELAIVRVAGRVQQGGHHIPEDTIRRRYRAGIENFFGLYLPLADKWSLYDTTNPHPIRIITECIIGEAARVEDPSLWQLMQERGKR